IAPAETRRHDTDKRPGRAIQYKRLVQNGGIGVESVDPHLVAQDENRWSARLIIRWLHHAPNQCGHAQKFERARRHIAAAEAVRALARSVEHVATVIGDHPVKDVVLRHIVQKLWSAVASSPARLILFRVMNL